MTMFTSDNVTPACPQVIDAIVEANRGLAASYGDDPWSSNLQRKLSEIFETEVVVFPAVTGTASNALALSALAPPYGKIYCQDLAHINTDECGAPELFTGGAKLIALPGRDGRLDAKGLAAAIQGTGNVHHAQPAVVSITQACETGTVYPTDQISGIAEAAHAHGMRVHMDGARFANAVVSLNKSPADITWKAGVDVLSFGGTKNGCMAAEAVVFFKPELAETFGFLHKRAGQLLSKMRFVAAQLEAYVDEDLWLNNARQANEMATRLSKGLSIAKNIELAYPTQSNEVFVRLHKSLIEHLKGDGFEVNEDELDGSAVRFVTAWNTRPEDVDRLLASVARHNQQRPNEVVFE